jgi:C-terminal processing protease CtpA/Prc
MSVRKFILLAFIFLSFTNCSTRKMHNRQVNQLVAVKKLKKDVDFAYSKLQKLHPALYWYVSKERLDFKFDSLKTTITKPLTSYEFYTKITPVINEVRQGHLAVRPMKKLMSKRESKELKKKGINPLSQFDFLVFDDKLFVGKNKSIDSTIAVGSEIISMDGNATNHLLKKYQRLMTSDGYNTTFFRHHLSRNFANYYLYENKIKDSLLYQFKFKDTLKNVWIKRKKTEKIEAISQGSVQKKQSKGDKKKQKLAEKERKRYNDINGFDKQTKTFQRNLSFLEKDSSVAVLKIKSFNIGNFKTFYEQTFGKIKEKKSITLIIDLRGNPGGRLREIANLYAFVADSATAFADKSEVVSKTSMLNRDYFSGNLGKKALQSLAYPFYVSIMYLLVEKSGDKYYFAGSESRVKPLQENRFKGRMYVLIDGGSFSASSILSTNLKGSGRATFVGEETGGAFNGTVAGQMPIIELPNSKVKMRVGLMKIVPHYKTEEIGRGIHPDIEIIRTLVDKINGNDPEMNWILRNINQENADAN